MLNSLNELFQRDIDNVIKELNLYENEADLWKLDGDIKNTAGNLGLHLAGNLLHFVGHMLGGSDYVRDRPYEFGAKGVPRQDIIIELEKAKAEINRVLSGLPSEKLKEIPEGIPYDFNWEKFLIHLYSHFSYHAGQVNYHRRLLS